MEVHVVAAERGNEEQKQAYDGQGKKNAHGRILEINDFINRTFCEISSSAWLSEAQGKKGDARRNPGSDGQLGADDWACTNGLSLQAQIR
jgi:hypothetical protein